MRIDTTRIHWLAGCLAVIAILAITSPATAAQKRNGDAGVDLSCPGCNVIFLNIELLRADFVGAISGSRFTPNIDAYFQNGIIFEDASAPAGETFLSNTAVLTGIKPHQIPFRPNKIDNFNKLEPEAQSKIRNALNARKSMAQTLAENGYHTISINQGGRAGKQAFLDRGFADYSQWSSKLLFEDMVDMLLQKAIAAAGRPTFILFRPTLLHTHQYRQPLGFRSEKLPATRYITYRYETPDGSTAKAYQLKRDRESDLETGRQAERNIYAQQLTYADDQLDQVFTMLKKYYDDNSIVVLYANHGSGLGDHGIFEHGTSYQSCVNVPILIKHPKLSSSIRVSDPVALIDLVPTIYKMLGIPRKDSTYDADLYDSIQGHPTEDRVLLGKNGWDEYIRIESWKLIVQYGRFRLLFNLQSDPGELVDLYTQRPVIVRQLESELLQHKLKIYANMTNPLR